jgi:hypothetical protein
VFEELYNLSTLVRETLCQLQMIFPLSFFYVMLYFPVHLAKEAELDRPVFYRLMYLIERYLRTLKGYV